MKKIKVAVLADMIIRGIFFFVFPAVWISGFAGVKNLCQQIHSGKPLELNAFLVSLILLVCFTVVFGRFFCGKACAFGTYGDFMYWLGGKIFRKSKKVSRRLPERISDKLIYLKFGILVLVCLLCVGGYSSMITVASPWSAFSYITSLRFGFISGFDYLSLTLFVVCSVLMMTEKRLFCRFVCPMGAVFAVLPILPFSMVRRKRSECTSGCSACRKVCPGNLNLPFIVEAHDEKAYITEDENKTKGKEEGVGKSKDEKGRNLREHKEMNYQFKMGECLQCGKCTNICPKKNAGCITMPGRSKGMAADLIKAAILVALMWYFVR